MLELGLNTKKEVLFVLDEILSLNGRSAEFSMNTPLVGRGSRTRFDGSCCLDCED